MGPRRFLAAATAALLAAGGGAAVGAPAGGDPESALRLARDLASVSTRPAPALAAVLAAQGTPVPALGPPTASPVPSRTPSSLARPVGALLGAARQAESLRARALARLTAGERARILAGGMFEASPRPAPAPRDGLIALVGSNRSVAAPEALAIGAKVDRDLLNAAAVLALEAIDLVTPDLRRIAGDPQPRVPSACGATGDMVFETSDCFLMIGGSGTNGYGPAVSDGQVLIDLGGGDSYSNGAARAEGEVRLLIDVDGNDTYSQIGSTAMPSTATLSVRGQGVGVLGVGVLADLGGSDSYLVRSTTTAAQPGPVAQGAEAIGQGASTLGAGVLVDIGGANSFTVESSSSGAAAAARGQGFGGAGLGALIALGSPLDQAAGDAYAVRAASTLHHFQTTPTSKRYTIGSATVEAQGAGDAGAGVMVEAADSDTYEARATGGVASSLAQGAGELGAGALIDAGGSDTMLARAEGDTELSLITTNPAFCYQVTVTVETGETTVTAQGGGFLGAGLLVDADGSDVRAIVSRSRAAAIAEARSNNACPPGTNTALADARSGPGIARGQGSGTTGAGVLVDLTGGDANDLEATSIAYARALAISPGADTETASADAGDGTTEGMGHAAVGGGILADALGSDRYVSTATKTETTVKSSGTISATTPGTHRVHGWGMTGIGWLVDVEGVDLYSPVAPVSGAGNDRCWTNGADGRGRDIAIGTVPSGCP